MCQTILQYLWKSFCQKTHANVEIDMKYETMQNRRHRYQLANTEKWITYWVFNSVFNRQAPSHYLRQWSPRYMALYGTTRPQWIKLLKIRNSAVQSVWVHMAEEKAYIDSDRGISLDGLIAFRCFIIEILSSRPLSDTLQCHVNYSFWMINTSKVLDLNAETRKKDSSCWVSDFLMFFFCTKPIAVSSMNIDISPLGLLRIGGA